jgi:predicted phosphodiesterase
MLIKVLSDTHLEHYLDRDDFIKSLDSDVDVLVLAGDIDSIDRIQDTLEAFSSKFTNVIFVPGNHEHYYSSPARLEKLLAETENRNPNLHCLRPSNRIAKINGQRFIGSTLWFSYDPSNIAHESKMNDFQRIDEFNPWVYEENKIFQQFIRDNLNEDDILVTHHLPSDMCIHPFWKGSFLNRFFATDMTRELMSKKPKLCIFGHTHNAYDETVNGVRFVCNPRAYPGELPAGEPSGFNPKMVLKV